jgi:enoyl-CoA hydratase/carnithine racemase
LSTDSTVITRDRSALWITINRHNDLNAFTPAGIACLNTACDEVENGFFRELLMNDPMAAEGFNSFKEGRKPNWL